MTTINIIAGPHCALKTTYFRGAFLDSIHISAEILYDNFVAKPELLLNNFLIHNFEDIWADTVIQTINLRADGASIVVDGVTLDDKPLGYNFSTPEGVYRFITILQNAAARGFIRNEINFVIHYLPLPLPTRQILNHRRRHPYTLDQLRSVYWDPQLDELGAALEIHKADDIFNDLKIEI